MRGWFISRSVRHLLVSPRHPWRGEFTPKGKRTRIFGFGFSD
jgi:hypothetical protein